MSIPSKLKNIAKRGIDRVIQTFNNCADEGKRRRAIFDKMKEIAKANDRILERTENLVGNPSAS